MTYLLFDIGGTNMRLAVSRTGRKIDECMTVPTPQNFRQGLKAIRELAHEMTQGEKIQAMVGGIHGSLNREKTTIAHCPFLPGWIGRPLVSSLARMFKCRVHLENDADLAGLGEAVFGAGRKKKIVAFLTISSGVGGTRIVNKRLDANAFGFEPGQQIINLARSSYLPNGPGRLEGYISGSALARRYKQPSERLVNQQAWLEVERFLVYGLVNVFRLWSPEIIVLGGGLMKSRYLSVQRIRQRLKKELRNLQTIPLVTRGALGQKAGLYGALKLISNDK